jgi:hypothetical protein
LGVENWEVRIVKTLIFNSQLPVLNSQFQAAEVIDQALSPWYESNIFEIFRPMGGKN